MASKCIDLTGLSSEEKKEFREKYDVFFFDMDGTLAELSKAPIRGAREAVASLAENGKKLYLYTDTCIHTKKDIVKLIQKDFPVFNEANVITAAWLLVKRLKDVGCTKKVYVIGQTEGIVQEFKDAGFDVLYDDEPKILTLPEVLRQKMNEDVGAVAVGADINFTYLKLMKAVNYLSRPGCHFLLSHTPKICFFKPIVPAAGALAIPIQAMTGKEPYTACKGSPASVELVRSLGHPMSRCLFVGDGLINDISCGNKCGMDTLLVLSGASTMSHVEEARIRGLEDQIPTYVAPSIAVLRDIFTS